MVLSNRSLGKHLVGGLTERQSVNLNGGFYSLIQKVTGTLHLSHTQLVNCGTHDICSFLPPYFNLSSIKCNVPRQTSQIRLDMILDFSHHFHFKGEDT